VTACALERIYLDHGPALHLYLSHRLRDPELAEDLAQEAFVRLVQAHKTGHLDNGRAYLFRIGHNLLVDHIRRVRCQRTETLDFDEWDQVHVCQAEIPRRSGMQLELAEVVDILGRMQGRTRRIFCLAKLVGLTHCEAAQVEGVSESAVQKHLAMAVAHVRQQYSLH
jgi:RNA polymerase sigma factor (sigma-70 family)